MSPGMLRRDISRRFIIIIISVNVDGVADLGLSIPRGQQDSVPRGRDPRQAALARDPPLSEFPGGNGRVPRHRDQHSAVPPVHGRKSPAVCQRNGRLITHTHTQPFNGALSGTTRVSRYQKGKTNLDFTEARVSEWQWHQLGHMQVCTSLQADNYVSTQPLSFFTDRMPFVPPNQQRQSTEGKWSISQSINQ